MPTAIKSAVSVPFVGRYRTAIVPVLLCLLLIFAWFLLIGDRTLLDPDEGRYAEIPREMATSGDWVTPRLLDFKYFEKPALQYWITAAAYRLFGVSEFTARFWTSLAGLLGALWSGFVAARLYGRATGYVAALLCLSSVLYFVGSHVLTLDMSLTLFLTIGMGSLVLAQQRRDHPGSCRRWMLLGWFALACAVLSKGLIGVVLPVLGVAIYTLWHRDWQIWRHLHIFAGSVAFLVVAAPWFVAVSVENHEFLQFFFIQEHLQRFLTEKHSRSGPVYYFLPVLLLGGVPWLGAQLVGLWRGLRSVEVAREKFDANRLLVSYALGMILFFSLSGSKLPLYVLPVVPVLAMLAARVITEQGGTRFDGYLVAILPPTAACLAWLFRGEFASTGTPLWLLEDMLGWIVCGCLLLGVAGVWSLKAQQKSVPATALTCLLTVAGLQAIFWGVQPLSATRSAQQAALLVEQNTGGRTAQVYLTDLWPSFAFYWGTVPSLVGVRGELAMGIEQDPARWISTREDFFDVWRSGNESALMLKSRHLDNYEPILSDSSLICTNVKFAVIIKSEYPPVGCFDFGEPLRPNSVATE